MSTKTKQKLPKWFNGELYKEGEVVQNPFSGEEYELNNVELSMYDFIMGCQYIMEISPRSITNKHIREFQEALRWFRINNAEAYMVLLD